MARIGLVTEEWTRREAWGLRVAVVLTLVGGVGAMVATDYWETATNDLAMHAAVAAAPMWLLALGGTYAFTRRHPTVAAWIGVALAAIALPGWAVTLAHACNAELDATVSMRSVELVSKRSVTQGKSTFLTATLAPWPPLTEPVVMGVQGATYDRLPDRGPIRARIGDGWLGYPWIEDLEPPE